MKYLIWTLVIFWTLGSFRGFSLAAKLQSQPQANATVKQEVKKENVAMGDGSKTFGRNFIIEYFKWNKDDYQERVDRLQPYLRKGVDEQAGLRFDSLTGSSSPEKTELWEVSETGTKTADLTFKVIHSITNMKETKDKKGKITKKPVKTGPFEKWIQVPVITDGKSFLINGIPTYTSKPETANIEPFQEKSESNDASPATAADIKSFLETFFKNYSTGTNAELEYLSQDQSIQPLGGTIVFKNIENLVITNKKKNNYTVKTDSIFIDKTSQAQLLQQYSLEVSKQAGRWQVLKFN